MKRSKGKNGYSSQDYHTIITLAKSRKAKALRCFWTLRPELQERDIVSKNEKPKELLVFLDRNKIIERGSKKDTSANWKLKMTKTPLTITLLFYGKNIPTSLYTFTCSNPRSEIAVWTLEERRAFSSFKG